MYNMPYFKANSQAEVLAFMAQHPFVMLCGCDAENRPVATHVPVLLQERAGKLFLQGHIMRQTDHHNAFVHNPAVLAIFSGAHTYISASWYESNQQQASTWNYQVVHAPGELRFLDDNALLDILERLTNQFENNPNSPSLVPNLSTAYVERLIKAIVAFEIEVSAIHPVFKLSQNKDEQTYRHIIAQLKKGDTAAQQVATAMERNALATK
jgi:transcriptional regulator